MRKLITAAVAATSLAVPAGALADTSRPLPPLDPVHVDGLENGCTPEYPCTPQPISVEVDKTYPSRLIAWVKGG